MAMDGYEHCHIVPDMETKGKFPNRLKQGLAKIRMSQAELARKLDRTPQQVNKWVYGTRELKARDLRLIQKATGLAIDDILMKVPAEREREAGLVPLAVDDPSPEGSNVVQIADLVKAMDRLGARLEKLEKTLELLEADEKRPGNPPPASNVKKLPAKPA